MKLAIIQIILGVLLVLIDALAIGATFSTQFNYVLPHGEIAAQVKPESVRVARWATVLLMPLGLSVIGIGIAQLRAYQRK
jgi:hypothetical protein